MGLLLPSAFRAELNVTPVGAELPLSKFSTTSYTPKFLELTPRSKKLKRVRWSENLNEFDDHPEELDTDTRPPVLLFRETQPSVPGFYELECPAETESSTLAAMKLGVEAFESWSLTA